MNLMNNNAHCMSIVTRSGKVVGSKIVKEDVVVEAKGKEKFIDEEEIPEVVKIDLQMWLRPNWKVLIPRVIIVQKWGMWIHRQI